jgi:predicted dehydrogenase
MDSPDFTYAGLVDINIEILNRFAEEHGLSKSMLYTDYKEAFRELKADAVLITAASPAHHAISKAALEAGLHLLIEKPFVLTMEDAMELVQLAEEKNLNIMVNQNYRFQSPVVTLKKVMQESELGKLQFINAQFFFDHNGKGYQREMDDYMLLEMGIHHVDMIRFLLDSDIASVRGTTWNYPDSGYKGDLNVNAAFMTESGIPVFYTGSLMARSLWIPWEGEWRLQYELGSISLKDMGLGYGVYRVDTDGTVTKLPFFVPERDGIHGVLAEFAMSIIEDREPLVSGRDNLKTLAALFATSQSSKDGTVVRVANGGNWQSEK